MNKNNLALAVAGTLIAAGAVAAVSDQLVTADAVLVYACKDAAGSLTLLRYGAAPTCKRGQTVISWNNQGPPGEDGAAGTPGAQGPTGFGVRLWKDANGQVVGPAISGVNFTGESLAEVTIGSRRFPLKIPRLYLQHSHPQVVAVPTDDGGFVYAGGGQNQFAERYSPNTDCSPPLYLRGQDYAPVGYDSGIQYDQYDFFGPEAGRIDLLILSAPLDPAQMACVIRGDGSQAPASFFFPQPRVVVQTINLTETYPAPLTLE